MIYVLRLKTAMKNTVKMIAATTTADLQDEMLYMTPLLEETGVTVPHHLLLKSSTGAARFSYANFGQFGGSRSSKRAQFRSMTGRSILMSGCRSTPLSFE